MHFCLVTASGYSTVAPSIVGVTRTSASLPMATALWRHRRYPPQRQSSRRANEAPKEKGGPEEPVHPEQSQHTEAVNHAGMRIVTSPHYVRIASISVTPIRTTCNITFREAQLEAADGAVIAEIVAGLGRIIAGEDDCHSVVAAADRLRIVNPAAEKS